MEPYVLSAIFLPFLFGPLFFVLEKRFYNHLGLISTGFSLILFFCIIMTGFNSNWKQPVVMEIPWIPSLGVNLTFLGDGLSLFFGILVTVMGVLVNFYSNFYMIHEKNLGRFYCCLTIFTGSMLGAIFCDNLLLLFIFWEMTGLASFLLVGFYSEQDKACLGAKTALFITSLTSLFLFLGILLIGLVFGTFQWSQIVLDPSFFSSYSLWPCTIILCFMIGIFGKSAQFPFQFWLPRAMVAPTPVSAYLHAATMVKLGIFLTARMYPLFVVNPIWFSFVTIICFTTMFIGALLSLLSNDLKAILAYATVSQLGFFIGFYGIGDEEGVQYDFIHILNHALYKGSLFMLVGIVDHATGIRDIRKLSGLWSKMPATTILFLISAAAMAGIPGTTGFLSKELILADLVVLGQSHISGWIILSVLATALLFKVAFSIRLVYHIFIRDLKTTTSIISRPKWPLLVSPFILSFSALFLGIWPTGLDHLAEFFYVSGLHAENLRELKLWHGWTIELGISLSILIAGTIIFLLAERTNWTWTGIPIFFHFDKAFDKLLLMLQKFCSKITYFALSPKHDTQYMLFFAYIVLVFGGYLVLSLHRIDAPHITSSLDGTRALVALLTASLSIGVVVLRKRVAQLISLSASGFMLTLYFILYRAPDLALTQILIESVTLFLILIFFSSIQHVPTAEHMRESNRRCLLKIALSLAMGAVIALAMGIYNFQSPDNSLKTFFLQATVPLAKGTNAVNTILVDFRGLDTLGEVSVLIIACLGTISILAHLTPQAKKTWRVPSIILKSILPFIFFLVNVFALYLLLKGHNFPGGGFIAGLCSAVSIILISIANPQILESIKKVNLVYILALGLGLILLVGSIPFLWKLPFLTHLIDFEYFSLNTPLVFDSGVFLIVLSMTIYIIFTFKKVTLNSVKISKFRHIEESK